MIHKKNWAILPALALAASLSLAEAETDSATQSQDTTPKADAQAAKPANKKAAKKKDPKPMGDVTELKTEDLKVGTGAEAVSGKMVSVHYMGWLTNGTKFDSSVDRNQPFQFQLGSGMVIKGWDQGVAGMKVGGKRKLTIPPTLGYGSRATGPIPPNSTLVFDVELLDVK